MFPVGAIVRRRLTGFWGWAYCHMGVYVGGDEVIHFNGERKKHKGARLKRETLAEFAFGQPVTVHAAPRSRAHGTAIVAAAERELARSDNRFNTRYSFVWNNCEDFCVVCFQEAYTEVSPGVALG